LLAFFTGLTQSTKQTKKYTKRTKRTKYALCNTAQYGAVQLSLTLSENVYKKLSQNTSKTLQNIRKTPQNTVFQKTLAKHHKNTRKTPTKHRKTPQNTTKHIC